MIVTFVKKRWFSIALVLIVLVAVARKNVRFQADDTAAPAAGKTLEKYTEDATPKATALMNIAGDGSQKPVRLPDVDDATTVAFLKRFASVAVTEQEKFGIPASVLLACAYLNSFAGQRTCATEANNYLATRCTADWGGPVVSISGACFRQYDTAWESIRDFNVYHSQKDWYTALKKSAKKDWKAWARGLAAHRVSDVEQFEAEMAEVIQAYRLFELDE
ncbi:MAG: glucosaminidase domain-containing protein [Lewinellaceae bacterium]|nr:glucosaminidase domain-containing protein [Lewinellaceae bacterium]